MTEQMIEEQLAKRQQINLQSMISPRQNLTFKQLCIYYEEKNLEPTQQFIESLDLRQSSGEFNYAALPLYRPMQVKSSSEAPCFSNSCENSHRNTVFTIANLTDGIVFSGSWHLEYTQGNPGVPFLVKKS